MNTEKVNVEIIQKDHYKDGKIDETLETGTSYYTVKITDSGVEKIFNIEENSGSLLKYNYNIKTNNEAQTSETNYVYLPNEDDFCDTQHGEKLNIDSYTEKPTIDIKNIMKILQYGKYYDFKDKQVDITYVRPKWFEERNNSGTHKNELIRKKITNFDFKKPKNIYSQNSLLDKIALKTKQIGRWLSDTWDDLQIWYHNRREIEANNRPAGINLTSVDSALESTTTCESH